MKITIAVSALLALTAIPALASESAPKEEAPPAPVAREITPIAGPDRVFDRPVGKVMPALAGAKRTKVDGRVGNEFVFWGYRLKDRRNVFFYACAPLQGVDCIARRAAICDASMKVVETAEDTGKINLLNCNKVCQVGEPTSQPCCTGTEKEDALQLGVVQCH